MAYFGIPVVALYDAAYVNFDFVHICYNKEDYFKVLRGEQPVIVNFDKEQFYSYYYQRNLEDSNINKNSPIEIIRGYQPRAFSFNDNYLRYLKKYENRIYSKEILNNYRNALEQCHKEVIPTVI